MVTFRSFLPAGAPHSPCEIGVRDNSFPPQNWICCQARAVLPVHHNPALGIQCEPAHCPGHRTRESQLARRIQKQQHALTDVVALAAPPKACPLVDSQNLSRRNASHGMFHLKGNGSGSRRLPRGYWNASGRSNTAGEDDPSGVYDSLKSDGPRDNWGHNWEPPEKIRRL